MRNYLQLMNFIRRFKGLPTPAKAMRRHAIEGVYGKWEVVSPAYEEPTGDVAPRDWPGYDACGRYRNFTGRNEFQLLRTAVDMAGNVVFMAETVKPLSPRTDPHWMELFVKVPGHPVDAMGYTHRVTASTPGVVTGVAANRVAYTVSAAALGIDTARSFRLEFKWSDNRQADDVMDFYVNGDAAPRGRLNWLFIYDPD